MGNGATVETEAPAIRRKPPATATPRPTATTPAVEISWHRVDSVSAPPKEAEARSSGREPWVCGPKLTPKPQRGDGNFPRRHLPATLRGLRPSPVLSPLSGLGEKIRPPTQGSRPGLRAVAPLGHFQNTLLVLALIKRGRRLEGQPALVWRFGRIAALAHSVLPKIVLPLRERRFSAYLQPFALVPVRYNLPRCQRLSTTRILLPKISP